MHQFRPRLALSLICLIFTISLFTSTVVAQGSYTNPVLEAARAAGLVTDIGLSQTVGDTTVTLDWAYADTQNIKLGYTLTTANGVDPDKLLSPYASPKLTDDKQASFSFASSSPSPGAQPNERQVEMSYYTQAIVPTAGTDNWTVNNDYFNPPPDKLNLRFELTLGDFSPQQGYVPNDGSAKPADYVEPLGPFTFDFTIPLYTPVVITPAQMVTVKNVTMTLEQVTITPTMTTARICYDMPDTRDWMPDGSVTLGAYQGLISGVSLVGGKEAAAANTTHRCRDMSYAVFHDMKPATLNVTIDHIAVEMSEGPDDWNRIKAELAKRNIQINVTFTQGEQGGGGIDVELVSIPDGVNYDQAVDEAREALGDWLIGPWTFTVDLP